MSEGEAAAEHGLPDAAAGESVDLLEAILDAVDDAITVLGADGRIVYANRHALGLLGYASLDELLAVSPREVLQRFELLTPGGDPLPVERLPSRRALLGEARAEEDVRYRVRDTGEERYSVVRRWRPAATAGPRS